MKVLLFALGASLPLLVGGLLGTFWRPPRRLLAGMMSLAAGALLASVAFELVSDSVRQGGTLRAAIAFAGGTVVFVGVDSVLERWMGNAAATPLAILAASTLDSLPENTALGVTLAGQGSVALLVAIAIANFPEGLAGAALMRERDYPRRTVVAIWSGTTLLIIAAAVLGRLLFAGADEKALALPLAFAGGAVLAAVVDTFAPEAFERGGPTVALATAVGFFGVYLLSS